MPSLTFGESLPIIHNCYVLSYLVFTGSYGVFALSDVATKVITDIFRFLAEKGYPISRSLPPQELPTANPHEIVEDYLFNPSNFISWNTYSAILDRFGRYFSDDQSVREYMAWSISSEAPWTRLVLPLSRFFVRPTAMYQMLPWVTKSLLPCLTMDLKVISSHLVTCRLEIRTEDNSSLLFFRFFAAAMESLPSIAGFKQSTVQMQSDGRTCYCEINVPPAKTQEVFRRFTLPIKALFSARALFNELSNRDREIHQAYLANKNVRAQLEREIYERRQNLEETTHQLSALMEHSPDNIVTVDRNFKITYINRPGPGYNVNDVIGRDCLEFIPESQRQAHRRNLEQAFAIGQPIQSEVETADGRTHLTRVVPLFDGPRTSEAGVNKVKQVMMISSDITAQKAAQLKLEQAREIAVTSNRAKSAFLANVSHELRTPLASIIGYSELLEQEDVLSDRETLKSYHRRIISNSRHLLSLVNDVLDLSKIEAGAATLTISRFDLNNLIEDVCEMFSIEASNKTIALQYASTQPESQFIDADEKRIRQILVNLVSNAIKFTQRGSVTITSAIADQNCLIKVTDTGPGIDQNIITQLFRPFEQGQPASTQEANGSGLGLYLSRQMARMMAGDVFIEQSTPGIGSTFVLQFQIGTNHLKSSDTRRELVNSPVTRQ